MEGLFRPLGKRFRPKSSSNRVAENLPVSKFKILEQFLKLRRGSVVQGDRAESRIFTNGRYP